MNEKLVMTMIRDLNATLQDLIIRVEELEKKINKK